ncbi:MAG: bifunctional enoyl-CoA hydratase/phosphate acetyltransferase [Pseudomonadota bacterium]|nr:bifunctional enoyl-CoA hydratase/phosphate acetyltransferase [Pseudomonadota bacterium]
MERLENRPLEELAVGDRFVATHAFDIADIERIAAAASGFDPQIAASGLASANAFLDATSRLSWASLWLAGVVAARFPGVGVLPLSSMVETRAAPTPGQTMTLALVVRERREDGRRVTIEAHAADPRGDLAMSATLELVAPLEKTVVRDADAPPAPHEKGARGRRLLDMARRLPALRTAVVHPVDAASLTGAVEAHKLGLIVAVLVGPEAKIRRAAEAAGIDLLGFEIVAVEHSHAAADAAVALAREGKVEAIMKGALHTDELMHAIVRADSGLRTARRLSHVFAVDAPHYARPLFITDAAVNIYPSLIEKRDIVQNAIDLTHALGVVAPRVAILSAVETVSPDIRSTIDAAALCKMADRGQITGARLDGPLAFDNAVSPEAARTKGIVSEVAGRADILVAPDLEAGNMIAKQLEYLADAELAGIVLGARVPIMLTSRSDGVRARLGSCALALLMKRATQG